MTRDQWIIVCVWLLLALVFHQTMRLIFLEMDYEMKERETRLLRLALYHLVEREATPPSRSDPPA